MYPNQQGGQGQPPPHWNGQQPSNNSPNGAYPPPSNISPNGPYPQHPQHPPQHDPRGDPNMMQQHPYAYRLPAPVEMGMYRPPPQGQDPYRQGPPSVAYPAQHQPAPRQRTAIACRYCRRRKIRCSGFENSEDGRCSNCVRFSQECIFTPVAAQTQAFVPAHTVWRGQGPPPPLYGAYGQPLHSSQQPQGAYPPPPGPRDSQGYPLPSPTGPYSPSPYPGGAYDDRGSRDGASGRKRPHAEPHTPTLPPPNPASASQLPAHRGPDGYTYPDPTNLTPAAVSPASSQASYQSAPPPQQQQAAQPYYTTAPPRRSSPQSAYSYEPSRASSSPNTVAPGTPSTAYSQYPDPTSLRPAPARSDGRSPPPTSQPANGAARPGMRISDIVGGHERSTTDSDMLNALNRRPM